MPEDKYVPNSAVMGGSSIARKVTFFGRDKIGAEKNAETPATTESSSSGPDSPQIRRPAPGSPAPDSSPVEITSTSTTIEDSTEPVGDSAPGSPGDGLPYYGRPRAVDGVHPERRSETDSPGDGSPAPDRPNVNLWSSLPQVDGHLRLPNVIID